MTTSDTLRDAVRRRSEVVVTFAQDSGHASYGVRDAEGRRWFVKTSADRLALGRTAEVHRAVHHPALLEVVDLVETVDGAVLVHPWFDGELLRAPPARRDDPAEAFTRFRELPREELTAALDVVLDAHVALEAAGWVAGDLYDGSLMYDFGARRIAVVDLECYRHGPFVNDVGRLPGSTRFMAPEEHLRGAEITARTTVFTLGRVLEVLAGRSPLADTLAGVVDRATSGDPADRWPTVAGLQRSFRATT